MSEKTNIYKIAEELGLSSTTVSRAISGRGRVSEATRQKVIRYIEEEQIVPAVHEKMTAAKKTKTILVTLPGEGNYALLPYFSEVLLSIYDYMSLMDYQVMIAKISASDISALETIVGKHKVDGVILTRTIQDSLDIKYLQKVGIPFVAIGSYDDQSVYQVDVNQTNSCQDMTSILLRMGIRKIALFCADRTHVVTKNRFHGFLQAYEDNGLEFDQRRFYDGTGDPLVAEKLTLDMIRDGMECILCMDDNICINVLNTLRKNGVRVPEDIKVASFYNSQLLDEYYPPISCVNFDIKELGKVAARTLMGLIDGEKPIQKLVLGYSVVLKESTL